MSKIYLNTLSTEEIIERLHNDEKIFYDTDDTSYAKYVDGMGICKFRKETDELLVVNLTLSLFSQLYFNDLKEDYESMIGYVGWFWDNEDEKRLGILKKVVLNDEDRYCFFRENPIRYQNFCPANKSELKFWGDDLSIGSYNEKLGIYCGRFRNKDVWCSLHDAPEIMNWIDAKDWCIKQGGTLPNIDTLTWVYLNKDEINKALKKNNGEPFKGDDYYWSSSEFELNYSFWHLNIGNGLRTSDLKNCYYYVRSFQLL